MKPPAVKRYTCHRCKASFQQKSLLKLHLFGSDSCKNTSKFTQRSPTGRYSCERCGEHFEYKSELIVHKFLKDGCPRSRRNRTKQNKGEPRYAVSELSQSGGVDHERSTNLDSAVLAKGSTGVKSPCASSHHNKSKANGFNHSPSNTEFGKSSNDTIDQERFTDSRNAPLSIQSNPANSSTDKSRGICDSGTILSVSEQCHDHDHLSEHVADMYSSVKRRHRTHKSSFRGFHRSEHRRRAMVNRSSKQNCLHRRCRCTILDSKHKHANPCQDSNDSETAPPESSIASHDMYSKVKKRHASHVPGVDLMDATTFEVQKNKKIMSTAKFPKLTANSDMCMYSRVKKRRASYVWSRRVPSTVSLPHGESRKAASIKKRETSRTSLHHGPIPKSTSDEHLEGTTSSKVPKRQACLDSTPHVFLFPKDASRKKQRTPSLSYLAAQPSKHDAKYDSRCNIQESAPFSNPLQSATCIIPVELPPVKPSPLKPLPVKPSMIDQSIIQPSPLKPDSIKPSTTDQSKPSLLKLLTVKPSMIDQSNIQPSPLKPDSIKPSRTDQSKPSPLKPLHVKPSTIDPSKNKPSPVISPVLPVSPIPRVMPTKPVSPASSLGDYHDDAFLHSDTSSDLPSFQLGSLSSPEVADIKHSKPAIANDSDTAKSPVELKPAKQQSAVVSKSDTRNVFATVSSLITESEPINETSFSRNNWQTSVNVDHSSSQSTSEDLRQTNTPSSTVGSDARCDIDTISAVHSTGIESVKSTLFVKGINQPQTVNAAVATNVSNSKGTSVWCCRACDFTDQKAQVITHITNVHPGSIKGLSSFFTFNRGEKEKKLNLRRDSRNGLFQCCCCPQTSNNKQSMQVHMRKHTGETPFRCTLCDYQAKNRNGIKRHVWSSHRQMDAVIHGSMYEFKDIVMEGTPHDVDTCNSMENHRVETSGNLIPTKQGASVDGKSDNRSVLATMSSFITESEPINETSFLRNNSQTSVNVDHSSPQGLSEDLKQPKTPSSTVGSDARTDSDTISTCHTGTDSDKRISCLKSTNHAKAINAAVVTNVSNSKGTCVWHCRDCDYIGQKAQVTAHITHVHRSKSKCSSGFFTYNRGEKERKLNLRRDPRNGLFQCCTCPQTSNNKQSMQVHIRSHTGETPFRCTLCDYQAKHRMAISYHVWGSHRDVVIDGAMYEFRVKEQDLGVNVSGAIFETGKEQKDMLEDKTGVQERQGIDSNSVSGVEHKVEKYKNTADENVMSDVPRIEDSLCMGSVAGAEHEVKKHKKMTDENLMSDGPSIEDQQGKSSVSVVECKVKKHKNMAAVNVMSDDVPSIEDGHGIDSVYGAEHKGKKHKNTADKKATSDDDSKLDGRLDGDSISNAEDPKTDIYYCRVCTYKNCDPAAVVKHIYSAHYGKTQPISDFFTFEPGKNETSLDIVRDPTSKKFKCCYCPKTAEQGPNMRAHIRQHSGEKPYTCKICSHQMVQQSGIISHIWKYHKEAVISATMYKIRCKELTCGGKSTMGEICASRPVVESVAQPVEVGENIAQGLPEDPVRKGASGVHVAEEGLCQDGDEGLSLSLPGRQLEVPPEGNERNCLLLRDTTGLCQDGDVGLSLPLLERKLEVLPKGNNGIRLPPVNPTGLCQDGDGGLSLPLPERKFEVLPKGNDGNNLPPRDITGLCQDGDGGLSLSLPEIKLEVLPKRNDGNRLPPKDLTGLCQDGDKGLSLSLPERKLQVLRKEHDENSLSPRGTTDECNEHVKSKNDDLHVARKRINGSKEKQPSDVTGEGVEINPEEHKMSHGILSKIKEFLQHISPSVLTEEEFDPFDTSAYHSTSSTEILNTACIDQSSNHNLLNKSFYDVRENMIESPSTDNMKCNVNKREALVTTDDKDVDKSTRRTTCESGDEKVATDVGLAKNITSNVSKGKADGSITFNECGDETWDLEDSILMPDVSTPNSKSNVTISKFFAEVDSEVSPIKNLPAFDTEDSQYPMEAIKLSGDTFERNPAHPPSLEYIFLPSQSETIMLESFVGSSVYKCPYCSKHYQSAQDVVLHIRKHTGDTPYHCMLCDFKSIHKTSIEHHCRHHHHRESFSSDTKSISYLITYNPCMVVLNKNVDRDPVTKKYTCLHCEMKFSSLLRVKSHINLHYTPYSCKACGFESGQVHAMISHIEQTHEVLTNKNNRSLVISVEKMDITKVSDLSLSNSDVISKKQVTLGNNEASRRDDEVMSSDDLGLNNVSDLSTPNSKVKSEELMTCRNLRASRPVDGVMSSDDVGLTKVSNLCPSSSKVLSEEQVALGNEKACRPDDRVMSMHNLGLTNVSDLSPTNSKVKSEELVAHGNENVPRPDDGVMSRDDVGLTKVSNLCPSSSKVLSEEEVALGNEKACRPDDRVMSTDDLGLTKETASTTLSDKVLSGDGENLAHKTAPTLPQGKSISKDELGVTNSTGQTVSGEENVASLIEETSSTGGSSKVISKDVMLSLENGIALSNLRDLLVDTLILEDQFALPISTENALSETECTLSRDEIHDGMLGGSKGKTDRVSMSNDVYDFYEFTDEASDNTSVTTVASKPTEVYSKKSDDEKKGWAAEKLGQKMKRTKVEHWVQCDECRKWRKLDAKSHLDIIETEETWYCHMNRDQSHDRCSIAEESYDSDEQAVYSSGNETGQVFGKQRRGQPRKSQVRTEAQDCSVTTGVSSSIDESTYQSQGEESGVIVKRGRGRPRKSLANSEAVDGTVVSSKSLSKSRHNAEGLEWCAECGGLSVGGNCTGDCYKKAKRRKRSSDKGLELCPKCGDHSIGGNCTGDCYKKGKRRRCSSDNGDNSNMDHMAQSISSEMSESLPNDQSHLIAENLLAPNVLDTSLNCNSRTLDDVPLKESHTADQAITTKAPGNVLGFTEDSHVHRLVGSERERLKTADIDQPRPQTQAMVIQPCNGDQKVCQPADQSRHECQPVIVSNGKEKDHNQLEYIHHTTSSNELSQCTENTCWNCDVKPHHQMSDDTTDQEVITDLNKMVDSPHRNQSEFKERAGWKNDVDPDHDMSEVAAAQEIPDCKVIADGKDASDDVHCGTERMNDQDLDKMVHSPGSDQLESTETTSWNSNVSPNDDMTDDSAALEIQVCKVIADGKDVSDSGHGEAEGKYDQELSKMGDSPGSDQLEFTESASWNSNVGPDHDMLEVSAAQDKPDFRVTTDGKDLSDGVHGGTESQYDQDHNTMDLSPDNDLSECAENADLNNDVSPDHDMSDDLGPQEIPNRKVIRDGKDASDDVHDGTESKNDQDLDTVGHSSDSDQLHWTERAGWNSNVGPDHDMSDSRASQEIPGCNLIADGKDVLDGVHDEGKHDQDLDKMDDNPISDQSEGNESADLNSDVPDDNMPQALTPQKRVGPNGKDSPYDNIRDDLTPEDFSSPPILQPENLNEYITKLICFQLSSTEIMPSDDSIEDQQDTILCSICGRQETDHHCNHEDIQSDDPDLLVMESHHEGITDAEKVSDDTGLHRNVTHSDLQSNSLGPGGSMEIHSEECDKNADDGHQNGSLNNEVQTEERNIFHQISTWPSIKLEENEVTEYVQVGSISIKQEKIDLATDINTEVLSNSRMCDTDGPVNVKLEPPSPDGAVACGEGVEHCSLPDKDMSNDMVSDDKGIGSQSEEIFKCRNDDAENVMDFNECRNVTHSPLEISSAPMVAAPEYINMRHMPVSKQSFVATNVPSPTVVENRIPEERSNPLSAPVSQNHHVRHSPNTAMGDVGTWCHTNPLQAAEQNTPLDLRKTINHQNEKTTTPDIRPPPAVSTSASIKNVRLTPSPSTAIQRTADFVYAPSRAEKSLFREGILQCPVCNHVEATVWEVMIHVRIKHSGETPFSCCHCLFTSQSLVHMIAHINRLHPASVFELSNLFHICQWQSRLSSSKLACNRDISGLRACRPLSSDAEFYHCTPCGFKSFQLPPMLDHLQMTHKECSYLELNPSTGYFMCDICGVHWLDVKYAITHKCTPTTRNTRHSLPLHTNGNRLPTGTDNYQMPFSIGSSMVTHTQLQGRQNLPEHPSPSGPPNLLGRNFPNVSYGHKNLPKQSTHLTRPHIQDCSYGQQSLHHSSSASERPTEQTSPVLIHLPIYQSHSSELVAEQFPLPTVQSRNPTYQQCPQKQSYPHQPSLKSFHRVADARTSFNRVADAQAFIDRVADTPTAINRAADAPTSFNRVADATTPFNRAADAPPSFNRVEDAPTAINRAADAQPSINRVADAQPSINRVADATTSFNRLPDAPTSINKTADAQMSFNRVADAPTSFNRVADATKSFNRVPDASMPFKRNANAPTSFNRFADAPTSFNNSEDAPPCINRVVDSPTSINRVADGQRYPSPFRGHQYHPYRHLYPNPNDIYHQQKYATHVPSYTKQDGYLQQEATRGIMTSATTSGASGRNVKQTHSTYPFNQTGYYHHTNHQSNGMPCRTAQDVPATTGRNTYQTRGRLHSDSGISNASSQADHGLSNLDQTRRRIHSDSGLSNASSHADQRTDHGLSNLDHYRWQQNRMKTAPSANQRAYRSYSVSDVDSTQVCHSGAFQQLVSFTDTMSKSGTGVSPGLPPSLPTDLTPNEQLPSHDAMHMEALAEEPVPNPKLLHNSKLNTSRLYDGTQRKDRGYIASGVQGKEGVNNVATQNERREVLPVITNVVSLNASTWGKRFSQSRER